MAKSIVELREEYQVLARLHSQLCNAFAWPEHPLIKKAARDMARVAEQLRLAKADR